VVINGFLRLIIMEKSAWKLFEGWDSSRQDNNILKKDWAIFNELEGLLGKYFDFQKNEILKYLDDWNRLLARFGGDPAYCNWREFRPLLLAREEGWSDWLVHLISKSKTGFFSEDLLKLANFRREDYTSPIKAAREVTYEGYRADIVIKWRNSAFTHVEVKIGDSNLAKTYGTAERMRKKFKAEARAWYDFILLMSNQVSEWDNIKNESQEKITPLTWEDISISLRRSLLFSNEDIHWLVWAYSLLGAAEQILLGYPFIDKDKLNISNISVLDSMLRILKEGKNEK